MNAYVNEAVPFKTWGNRQVLTRKQVVEMPWLKEFIAQFPKCFEYDFSMDLYVFDPEAR